MGMSITYGRKLLCIGRSLSCTKMREFEKEVFVHKEACRKLGKDGYMRGVEGKTIFL